MQSIAKQYNILPSEQENLHYSDWYRLVAGLMHDTPLGQIVRIRSEDNKDIIKNFDRYEKQIRSEWTAFRSQKAKETFTEQDKLETARYFERLFKGMFGKAGDK
ncbi:MAG TPA: Gp15 family bacteriophage protein [Oscillospiraceae bacterium]|nr:Gp15 family bacteriophage protein [Oscillospiraceae bacterium]